MSMSNYIKSIRHRHLYKHLCINKSKSYRIDDISTKTKKKYIDRLTSKKNVYISTFFPHNLW